MLLCLLSICDRTYYASKIASINSIIAMVEILASLAACVWSGMASSLLDNLARRDSSFVRRGITTYKTLKVFNTIDNLMVSIGINTIDTL